MKVWNLIYIHTETDSPNEATVRVSSFSSEKLAEEALSKEFHDTLNGLEADSILDMIEKNDYGNNAVIKLGYKHESDPDLDEISDEFIWRVAMTTIDFHTIEDRVREINEIDGLSASIEDKDDICSGEDLIRVEYLGKAGDELVADIIVEHTNFPSDLKWVRSDEASNTAWFKLED